MQGFSLYFFVFTIVVFQKELKSLEINKVFFNDSSIAKAHPLPIVLWHGIGDYYSNSFMSTVTKFLHNNIPGVYVMSIKIGSGLVEDYMNNYFGNANEHVSYACKLLADNPRITRGYNAIGFSQGAQLFRAVIQRCPAPPVRNFISLGGQHQGVYGIPYCSTQTPIYCDHIRGIITIAAYLSWFQEHLIQAQYWHDPLNEDLYKKKSIFLADINNEKIRNVTYRQNLLKLENFVLVKFDNDTVVNPSESEWFGFYKPGQKVKILSLQESQIYKEDWLGLRELDQQKKIHFLSMTGDHMNIDWTWFRTNIIQKFLL